MRIAFDAYDAADERRRESLFGLGNGVLFLRASPPGADAADLSHYPGAYHAGLYDRRDVTTDGQRRGHASLVRLPDPLALSFRPAGERTWFSLGQYEILEYRHVLDMARGVAERRVLVRDSAGRRTRLHEARLVSMYRPHLAATRLEIAPENWSGPIELRTALDAAVQNANTDGDLLPPYRHLVDVFGDGAGLLAARLRHAGTSVAIAARTTVAGTSPFTVERVGAIATSRDPAVANPTDTALAETETAPCFAELAAEQARTWQRLWQRVGIAAQDEDLQRELGFHCFHLLQTVSPHSTQRDVGLPSRGWQEAYHGHVFWDEIFAFPFLNHRFPGIARGLLLYRYRRLSQARRAARAAGYAGAMFPWRSAATGAEETPSFQVNPLTRRLIPDDTRLQRHIGAAIAHNIWTYHLATGDAAFLADYGAEMLVEIARFWASIARHDARDDRYDICGVVGPDEYHSAYPDAASAGLDNNAYTNVMASRALRHACAALDALPPRQRPELAGMLGLGPDEPARWQRIAARLRLCFTADGVLSQFRGYDRLRPLDAQGFRQAHPRGRVDHVLDARGDSADAYQLGKQPDVLMLLYLFPPETLVAVLGGMGYATDIAAIDRTARFYLDRMTHESSLSQAVCAGALARFDPPASWAFFRRTLGIDFDAANSATAQEGPHLGAMAATLDVLQRQYLGLRAAEGLVIDPAPPPALGPVQMSLQYRTAQLALAWDGAALTVTADPANHDPAPLRLPSGPHPLAPGAAVSFSPRRSARA